MTAIRLSDRLLWALPVLVGAAIAVYAIWPKREPLPVLSTVAPFTLTERSGTTVTSDDLRGRTWIAGFTFNCCTMSCPQIRAALKELQEELGSTRVTLVSFSVDPDGDTPEALRELAAGIGADRDRWLFLTAHGMGTLADVNAIAESFLVKVVANPSAPAGERISHTNRLFLVDRKGQVRGTYHVIQDVLSASAQATGTFQIDSGELNRLRRDAIALDGGPLGSLVRLNWLPTWNATLNGTSGVLLVLGWLLIRRGKVTPHAICMLAAVLVSSVFLASYLYYHFYAGATRFAGEGWSRPVYFTILLSHTLLAVTVPPLAAVTLYRAATRQWDRHRRIARWTMPIWLYVSVTGVLTYLFLYHWFAA